MDMIEFNGKYYKIREVEIPDLGIVNISTQSLNEVLLPDGSSYASEVARRIDETIYYFVQEEEINLPEDELIALLIREVV